MLFWSLQYHEDCYDVTNYYRSDDMECHNNDLWADNDNAGGYFYVGF